MASVIYNSYLKKIGDGSIDFDTDTIKVALVTSAYVPNIDTHDFFDDLTNEVTGAGYTAGGATLGSKTVTVDTSNDSAIYDGDDVSWTTSTFTTAGAVIYKSTGVASTSPLIQYIDFGSSQITSASTFRIIWNVSGLFYVTQG